MLAQQLLLETKVDQLKVCVYRDRATMGAAAAKQVIDRINTVLAQKDQVRMVFAAAPSQNELLDALCASQDIDWSRVVAFHMDEYIGLASDAPERFAHYLQTHLFERVAPQCVHLIQTDGEPEQECDRYARMLTEAPLDIVCLGIGENGHIAFNDPGVADFADNAVMKPVELDEECRQQQVNDGCFPNLESVPKMALTLTIPTLMSAAHLVCVVPGATKREAVQRTLTGPITPTCPASILRTHADCTLYVDLAAHGVTDV